MRAPYPWTVPNDAAATPHRIERALGVMAATVILLSVLAILGVLIAGAARVDVSQTPWPAVITLPLIGFPLGILLILAFFVTSAVRRSREARDAR